MKSSLARELNIADVKVQYDDKVKRVLGQKIILAHIMKNVLTEYATTNIEEIVQCIEGNPEISIVKVNPGETNGENEIAGRVHGLSNEDKVPDEGTVYFDIRFYAYVPQMGKQIKLIMNLEAQKYFYTGYEIVTRGIFYGGRMISAQLDTEFEIPNYDDLKKVYSIWICMNAPYHIGNAISSYLLTKQDLVEGIPDKQEAYDKITVIIICLNEKAEKKTDFLAMLNLLLSPTKNIHDKVRELEEKFQISMESNIKEEENLMCNLSDLVEEIGIEKGYQLKLKELIEKKLEKGIPVETIAEMLETTVEQVETIALEKSKI